MEWLRGHLTRRIRNLERGATLTEYALLASLFVVVAGLAASGLQTESGEFLSESGEQLADPAELEFDGDANGGSDAAPTPPYPWYDSSENLSAVSASASSRQTGPYSPGFAINGTWGAASDVYASEPHDFEPRLTLDMGEEVSFETTRLWNRVTCCRGRFRDLLVVISDTPPTASPVSLIGSPKTVLLSGLQASGGDYVDVPLNSWTGRYLSVYRIYDGVQIPFLQLAEVEVQGWRANE